MIAAAFGEAIIAGGFAQLLVLATITGMVMVAWAGCIGWVIVQALRRLAAWLTARWEREEQERERLRMEARYGAKTGKVVRR